MTTPSDLVTLVVRAHEVIGQAATDMGGFLQTYGVADGSIEIAAALSVVFVTWVLAAILVGGVLRMLWQVAKRLADRGAEAADGGEAEQMQ